jgi:hypothetical protein
LPTGYPSAARGILGGGKDEGENKIPTRLLHRVAHLDRIPLQFELVTVYVDIQVQVFILIAFAVNEKTALLIPFAELCLSYYSFALFADLKMG